MPGDEPLAYVEFFRVDQGKAVRRFLVPAVLLLTVGPPMILVSATMKQIQGHGFYGVLGAMLMGAGLVMGFGGIAVLILDDRYLGVTEEGLMVHLGDGRAEKETFYRWEHLRAVRHERDGLILDVRDGAQVTVPFPSPKLAAIAERLEEYRRKSAWNLAPPPPL